MELSSRTQWTRFASMDLLCMTVVLVLGEAVGLGIAYITRTSHPELSKIFAGGAATLLFGALLGGIVTLLIADFDRRRVQRAAQLDFISNVLADLKGVYDRVDRGRTLIRAHQSAKTYGDEMRNFIEARVKLLNVVRALKFDERGAPITRIRANVAIMEEYLKTLIDEFEREYKEIARSQSLYEARMKQIIGEAVSASDAAPRLPKNEPWEAISTLPRVADFMDPLENGDANSLSTKSEYCRLFLLPLDEASSRLRAVLRAELA
jgi:hypothetical protein